MTFFLIKVSRLVYSNDLLHFLIPLKRPVSVSSLSSLRLSSASTKRRVKIKVRVC